MEKNIEERYRKLSGKSFTRDPRRNQRIIMEQAANLLGRVLEREGWTKEYVWRLRGAIKLLRYPPERNDGRFRG